MGFNSAIEKIEKVESKNYTLIVVGNRLDVETVADFSTTVKTVSGKVIVDMSNVELLTSAGIGSLLMLSNRGFVVIVGMKPEVKRTVDRTGVSKRFVFCDTIEEAEGKITNGEEMKDKTYNLLVVEGRLDIETVPRFTKKVENFTGNVILDMTNLDMLTSAGVGALLVLMRRVTVYIVGLKPFLKKVIDVSGLSKFFIYCDTIKEAEEKIKGGTK